MKRVRVTFYVEPDDLDHPTGVTEDTYNEINSIILNAGAEDVNMELVDDEDE